MRSPLLKAIAVNPGRTAVLLDVDGTLAPIVERPEDAAVPEQIRQALKTLSQRYRLVACVSGRRALDARRVVGLTQLHYIGGHGTELLQPNCSRPTVESGAEGNQARLPEFLSQTAHLQLEQNGIRVEDKGHLLAFHWRGAADQRAAQNIAERLAGLAGRSDLTPYWGRKVLEVRATADINKGTAVSKLIKSSALSTALYAGDDVTDLDAFRALHRLREEGTLKSAVCVGVGSAEQPPEMAKEADLMLDGPDQVLSMLNSLAE